MSLFTKNVLSDMHQAIRRTSGPGSRCLPDGSSCLRNPVHPSKSDALLGSRCSLSRLAQAPCIPSHLGCLSLKNRWRYTLRMCDVTHGTCGAAIIAKLQTNKQTNVGSQSTSQTNRTARGWVRLRSTPPPPATCAEPDEKWAPLHQRAHKPSCSSAADPFLLHGSTALENCLLCSVPTPCTTQASHAPAEHRTSEPTRRQRCRRRVMRARARPRAAPAPSNPRPGTPPPLHPPHIKLGTGGGGHGGYAQG